MDESTKYFCRICGFKNDDPPWGENGDCASFEICPCCRCEYGYDDYTLESIREYRKTWIDNGATWATWAIKKYKPDNWSLEDQLKNIPPEFL